MASTMPRPWRRPTSGWRWELGEQPRHRRRRMLCCWWIGWVGWPRPWGSRARAGGTRGRGEATASSEAADVVLLVDRLDRLPLAMGIARRSRGIAVQSVVIGMGLSLIAMAIAAVGWLPPAPGALLQEGIDIAVLFNALRALQGDARERMPDSSLPGTSERLRAA